MKYFLDTNVFLRVVARDDKKSFEVCKALLGKIKEGQIEAVTSSLVLAEMVWTLGSHYGWEKNRVVRCLRGVVNLGGLKIVNGHKTGRAVDLYSMHQVKFVDAMIASNDEIRDGEWTVVSYDRDFDKLGVKRCEPGAI